MENPLNTVLIITAIGMTLLFLALALFYGLMSALTTMIRDRVADHSPQVEGSKRTEEEAMFQAAAIAVALARSEADREQEGAASPWREESSGSQMSSWWMLHHQRQLILNANRRRAV